MALSFLALGVVVPRAAQAQGAGVTCKVISGVYVCGDGSLGNSGNACVVDTGTLVQTCTSSGGGTVTSQLSSLGTGFGQLVGLPAQSSSTGWLSKLTGWIANVVHTVFVAAVQVLKDLVTYIIGVVLGLVASAISAIGVPSWLSQYSMGSILANTGSTLAFFLVQLQIPAGLSLIGAGYAFRLTRKFLTLFQW
ncbi:hypothetical protein AB4076_11590 [Dyella sp. 2RAF44]|uniref:hypothetical protein n=1 Tax=Dyella sp. 2RAF44 TaxID=3233000 RepID=UPI003F92822C